MGLMGGKHPFRESHQLSVFYQTGSHYVSEYVTTQQKCKWTGGLKLQFSRCNNSAGLQVDQRSRTAVFLPKSGAQAGVSVYSLLSSLLRLPLQAA
jgi:hypothetical protein